MFFNHLASLLAISKAINYNSTMDLAIKDFSADLQVIAPAPKVNTFHQWILSHPDLKSSSDSSILLKQREIHYVRFHIFVVSLESSLVYLKQTIDFHWDFVIAAQSTYNVSNIRSSEIHQIHQTPNSLSGPRLIYTITFFFINWVLPS